MLLLHIPHYSELFLDDLASFKEVEPTYWGFHQFFSSLPPTKGHPTVYAHAAFLHVPCTVNSFLMLHS